MTPSGADRRLCVHNNRAEQTQACRARAVWLPWHVPWIDGAVPLGYDVFCCDAVSEQRVGHCVGLAPFSALHPRIDPAQLRDADGVAVTKGVGTVICRVGDAACKTVLKKTVVPVKALHLLKHPGVGIHDDAKQAEERCAVGIEGVIPALLKRHARNMRKNEGALRGCADRPLSFWVFPRLAS
ncbi:MAG: hypothetical protein J6S76_04670 [Clostridia bacterium]|nr:hypothetical protein [Clostridia bacterium]